MSWFSKVKTLEDLKKEYKKLAMQYHPDRPGGDTAKMQQINGEYDRLFPAYQAIHNRTAATPSQETAAQTRSEFYTQNGWKGDNYHPDRSTAEVSKILREYAKRVYPDHKLSITTHTFAGGSSIHVALMAAPYEAFADGKKQSSLNQYYLQENTSLTPQAKKVMLDMNRVINSYRRSDCDSMIDYFDVSFYYDLSIGRWNKPFEVKAPSAAKTAGRKTVSEVLDLSGADFSMSGELDEAMGEDGDLAI